eukprot:CAMPEP_0195008132 /NCGR_PEP_ID=MMETSP0326_2-20130528/8209_1 /TAXON_ID=2866 ORGANISM="Crypthecodinium cohnii, Strain Seligo" /NCGR_SAMPLE_ID=MMETSP0326_2 /ASSEMBLY_ACC=CAM_ASM_000348 /LENGTH=55 /DNA_ID=CAMNT_0040015807 /DNA_START=45 /DNA_END=208 /DNA_ORIENTATION=+
MKTATLCSQTFACSSEAFQSPTPLLSGHLSSCVAPGFVLSSAGGRGSDSKSRCLA